MRDRSWESVKPPLNKALYFLARFLSWVFHPFVIAGPTLWYAIYATTQDVGLAWRWTGFALALVIVPGILFIFYKLRRREYTDADVSRREHRFSIYFFMGACQILFIVILFVFGAPRVLMTCFLAGLFALSMVTLATTKTKVSAHTGVIGGCTVVLCPFFPGILLPALGFTVALGWSRVFLKQHTLFQVVTGWLIAVSSVSLAFYLASL